MTPQERLNSYRPPNDLLEGHVILVTGASRGIGRAVSVAAAKHGAQLVALARDTRALGALADELAQAGLAAPGLLPVNLEGASVDDYANCAELVASEYGQLNSIVLNAGILGEMSPLSNYDPTTWARVFQVNVHAQFLLLRAFLPLVEQTNDGAIVFTASGVGRRARAYWGAYAASKFAHEGMMQVLADELDGHTKIRVNSLNPGRTRTAMRAAAYPAEDPATLPPPEALVGAYLFLLGRDSADISVKL